MSAANEESSREAATLSAELELLAVEAGILPVAWCNGFAASGKSLAKFAESVEAAVRKECAKKCRAEATHWKEQGQADTRDFEICALLIERANAVAHREAACGRSGGAEC